LLPDRCACPIRVALIPLDGHETKRVQYAALLGTDGHGASVPYSSDRPRPNELQLTIAEPPQ
jgi:hypothetical protein